MSFYIGQPTVALKGSNAACCGTCCARPKPCRLREDVAMTQAANRKDFDRTSFLHPAGAFGTPKDIVADPDLTFHEKRAILAALASNACAVEASPETQRPASAPIVCFNDIMDALKELDGEAARNPLYGKLISRARRWKDLYRRERGGSLPA